MIYRNKLSETNLSISFSLWVLLHFGCSLTELGEKEGNNIFWFYCYLRMNFPNVMDL